MHIYTSETPMAVEVHLFLMQEHFFAISEVCFVQIIYFCLYI